MSVFMILTADGVDQIVETKAIALRERRDLIRLGCDPVRIREFPSWAEAEAYQDKLAGR